MQHEQQIISLDAVDSLGQAFLERARRTPHELAYVQYEQEQWREYSWQQTLDEVCRWQAAMTADGLQAGDRVAIMCANRWEWVVCDQAAQGLGLVTVPVYTNDRSENIAWILQDAGASMLLVQNAAQWQLLQPIKRVLAQLRRIVSLEPLDTELTNYRLLDDWRVNDAQDYQLRELDSDALATIVYTSGTTGKAKGVMLSHYNILWNISAALQQITVLQHDMLLSFLPLSHTLERTAGYYLPIMTGTPVAFSRSIAQLADDLLEIQPTIMISVPRIFERVYGKIMGKLEDESALKQKLFRSAIELGWQKFEYQQGRASWSPSLLIQPLLDLLVGSKVRAKLGGRLRFTVCGGAALSEEVAKLFIGLQIPILQGYGLTEASPVIAANTLSDNLPASVGTALPGVETRVSQKGELLTRSPSVMLGYWNNAQASKEVINEDGWLRTGDKVQLDAQGHIRITGRLKEIIVMSNGEKVPPAEMENALALDELIDQVIVIGEGRPYLSALIIPNPEAFEEVAEHWHLDPANEDTYSDEHIKDVFMEHVDERTKRFPGYARIRQIAVVHDEWTPDNGLMTPTLKLRRKQILQHHHDITERLYAGHKRY